MNPVILYNNLLEQATLTVTSTAAGFEKENAIDGLPWDFWQAAASGTVYFQAEFLSPVNVNAWGVFAHQIGDNGGSIKLQYHNGTSWVDFSTAINPNSTEPRAQIGATQNRTLFRFAIDSPGVASKIGGLWLGEYLEIDAPLPFGFRPDHMGQQYEVKYNNSVNGAVLGASVYKIPIKNSLRMQYMGRDWARSTLKPFLDHYDQGRPFLLIPQPEIFPEEVTLCYADKKRVAPDYASHLFMNMQLPYIGYVS